jgi:DNA-binding NarL/FixJ family response regulator
VEQAQAEENLAIALTLQGNPRAGLAVATAPARRCRELRLDTAAYLVAAQGGCHSLIGEHELAEALLDEAEAMSPEGDLNMKLTVQGIHGDMALRSGRVDEAVEWLQAATDTYRALPGSMPTDAPAWLAVALASAGRTKEASEALEFARSVPDPARWHARPVIVAAAAALIDGSPDAVDEAMASATGRMPFDLALIRELAARMLDAPQKGQWLRDALEAYEAAGDSVDGDRIRRLLREAGEPVPRRKRRPEAPVPDDLARHGVTTREAEVLRLLGDGLSNADIAARLYVSVRTVESHVSSLLTKLGVDSRGKLTAISAATPWEASA